MSASGKSYGLVNAAQHYHNLKIIQNTVRVPSSLYSMNLGALNVYQNAASSPYKVNWNQMSDRVVRHYQTNSSTSQGSMFRGSSTRHTQPGMRPGSTTPGGSGVDIKHNSYYRYLARIKGRGPIRRGPVPPDFGIDVPFNRAAPIYGGKTMKTSIVADCNCPIDGADVYKNEYKLYHTFIDPTMFVVNYVFQVGQSVWAKETPTSSYSKATIVGYASSSDITLLFEDGSDGTSPYDSSELLIYYPCNCNDTTFESLSEGFGNNTEYISINGKIFLDCLLLNKYTGANALYNFFLLIAPLLKENFSF